MKLSLGFSPCPNDTFIFYGMIHGKVNTEGLEFEVKHADVEELNRGAFNNELDITKLSYHAYAYAIDDYVLLNSGSALGNNCGPLLISKKEISKNDVNQRSIAIPGKYTTANFLLSLAFPEATDKTEMLFSEIENALLEEQVEAGLIIHENRFTYQEKGLKKIIDLGEFWETNYKAPIPLGGIVVKRELPKAIQQKVDRVLRRSVEYAFQHPEQTMEYVAQFAQEMDQEVMKQHIDLYVNDFTVDLGEEGKAAIQKMYDTAVEKAIISPFQKELFIV